MSTIPSEPKRDYTNINNFDFKQKLENVKKDGKDNIVAVDKETGNVTILTYPDEIPPDFAKEIPYAGKVNFFEDQGEDDSNVKPEDINKFMMEVKMAGTKYDPSAHLSMLRDKMEKAKIEANDRIGDRILYRNIEKTLDEIKFSYEKLEQQEVTHHFNDNHIELDKIEKYNKYLDNVGTALYLGRPIYLYAQPEYGLHNVPHEPQLAIKLKEIAYMSNFIKKHIEEG